MAQNESKKHRGGKRTGAGRPKGSMGKKVVERKAIRAKQKAHEELVKAVMAKDPVGTIKAARETRLKLGKEILSEFANVLAGMAATVQPPPPGLEHTKPKHDYKKFVELADLAIYAAEKAASFESPKLAAIMTGVAQTKKITVEGGLPDTTTPVQELPPDMYDDSVKTIDGHVERNTDGEAADVSPRTGQVLPQDS